MQGREGRAEKQNLSFSTSQGQYCFSARHTQGIPSHGSKSQTLCLSTETSLGMLQAIRGNVMPRWEFRREKKNKSKGVKYEERHRR